MELKIFVFKVLAGKCAQQKQVPNQLCPQSCRFVLLRVPAVLRPLRILSPFCALLKRPPQNAPASQHMQAMQ